MNDRSNTKRDDIQKLVRNQEELIGLVRETGIQQHRRLFEEVAHFVRAASEASGHILGGGFSEATLAAEGLRRLAEGEGRLLQEKIDKVDGLLTRHIEASQRLAATVERIEDLRNDWEERIIRMENLVYSVLDNEKPESDKVDE